jgi:hypothetical protein
MSDIVFLRTWYKIEPEKFYNPVMSYGETRLMKTIWQLRKEQQIKPNSKPDSEYKLIERKKRVFNPLIIPKVKSIIFLEKFRVLKLVCHSPLSRNFLKSKRKMSFWTLYQSNL